MELNEKLARWAGDAPVMDLTSSLDAQAKWLWPELDGLRGGLRGVAFRRHAGAWISELLFEGWMEDCEGTADTPAMACALAIEKVVDGT